MSSQDDNQADNNGGDVLNDRPLIVASNRGPVTFTRERDGTFASRKGSGGVVTAVSSIARDRKPIWVACPMDEGDRLRAELAAQKRRGCDQPARRKSRLPGPIRRCRPSASITSTTT